MRFLFPLGFAAGALALPLALWYVLRSRRPKVTVASTFLWERERTSVAAAVPWQRFRPDRTFWLVLLALCAVTLALARPAIPVTTALGDHTVLVVDASASMLADENGTTRLELARREAEALVADLAPGQSVSVLEAGATARVLLSGGSDAATARTALRRVAPSEGRADLAGAFLLAAALERPDQATVHHLFTDGVLPEEAVAVAPGGLAVHSVAEVRPNLAVTRLEAVGTGGGAAQVFVQVRNYGLTPATARLHVAVDGDEVVSRELELPLRGLEDVILPVVASSGEGMVEAWVAPARTAASASLDALQVDDRAYAVLRGPRRTRVLLVTPGNVFLEHALEAVEGVEVRTARGVPPELAGIDLLVVDRAAAPAAPTIPTMLFAATAWPDGVRGGPAVELPAITYQSPDHPLLADADIAGTAMAEATPLEAAALETIVSGPQGALVVAGSLGTAPIVAAGFDLLHTNLPLQVAWPVMVANAVSWLTAPPAAAPLAVGDELRFSVPAGVAAVEAYAPDGRVMRVDAARPRLIVDRAGVWTAAWVAAQGADRADVEALVPPAPVPVNVPAGEGDLARPQPRQAQSSTDVAGTGTGSTNGTQSGAQAVAGGRTGLRDIGHPLLVAALALLVVEWLLASGLPSWLRRRRTEVGVR